MLLFFAPSLFILKKLSLIKVRKKLWILFLKVLIEGNMVPIPSVAAPKVVLHTTAATRNGEN
ncbi:MAG: hypothetical protein ACJA1Z_000133 [Patiriisocius sp.]